MVDAIGGRENPGAVDACRELVHAPIDHGDQTIEQIGTAMHRLFRCRAGGADTRHDQKGGQNGCERLGSCHELYLGVRLVRTAERLPIAPAGPGELRIRATAPTRI